MNNISTYIYGNSEEFNRQPIVEIREIEADNRPPIIEIQEVEHENCSPVVEIREVEDTDKSSLMDFSSIDIPGEYCAYCKFNIADSYPDAKFCPNCGKPRVTYRLPQK